MEVAWMMLANHAEVAPNGLLYISGGTWDTVNVSEPLPPDAPAGAVAFVQGVLIMRLGFHATESDVEYPFRIQIMDEDGREIGFIDGDIRSQREAGLPQNWPHHSNVIVSLTGLPLPRFGQYRINVTINREHKGETPFRAVRRY